LEHRAEKTPVCRYRALGDFSPNIFGVYVPDPGSVAARQRHGIGSREGCMAPIEQQGYILCADIQQSIDILCALHPRTHVVMVNELDPFSRDNRGELAQTPAQ